MNTLPQDDYTNCKCVQHGQTECLDDFRCKRCYECLNWKGYEEGTSLCGECYLSTVLYQDDMSKVIAELKSYLELREEVRYWEEMKDRLREIDGDVYPESDSDDDKF